MELILETKEKVIELVTLLSLKDTAETWYTELLVIVKPGGKVVLYNGISPEGVAP